MRILDAAAQALSLAGYTTQQVGEELRFEDASILGFATEFATAQELIEGWKHAEDTFLRASASALRRDRRKAWNIYSVLLTSGRVGDDELPQVLAIEEEFRATRKIARAGLATDQDVVAALKPLLPMQRVVTLHSEDAIARVSDRLPALSQSSIDAMLRGTSPEHLAQLLLAEEEQ